jgi:hypothetical protein
MRSWLTNSLYTSGTVVICISQIQTVQLSASVVTQGSTTAALGRKPQGVEKKMSKERSPIILAMLSQETIPKDPPRMG